MRHSSHVGPNNFDMLNLTYDEQMIKDQLYNGLGFKTGAATKTDKNQTFKSGESSTV